ncbi:hypothetical protein [Pseudomonas viridiflava]|uniref:hypothetical protein n=1 Tax=Pseudomonas viridiflava TaxID=33069 RepID=UPI000F063C06|nr:hypothetical protein [Pseudomonas viridiflava]
MSIFNWKENLSDLFAATVNQQTIEEAAEVMASVGVSDEGYHRECIFKLDEAMRAIKAGDNYVIDCINRSGYQVGDIGSTLVLLGDLKDAYLKEFSKED